MAGPQSTLTVVPTQDQVQLEASESSDPGDSSGHMILNATITAPQVPARMISGELFGKGRPAFTPGDGTSAERPQAQPEESERVC